jgi:hypothetical protein
MPTFLSDPTDSLYITLFVLMLAGIGIWVRYRSRKTMIAAGIGVGLFLGLLLIDAVFESPREMVVRKANAMEADFNSGDWNKFEKHIAENFEHKGKKKKEVKEGFEFAKANKRTLAFWGFQRDDIQFLDGGTAVVGFDAKPSGADAELLHRYVKAKFVKGSNGQWQLVGFETYHPLNHNTQEDVYGGW